ncbi:MAG: hypothetical protein KDA20_05665 [Phycisphaerales bacterium]|nr:hypothetical protein [Phycisphaerales bacterium]
MLGLLALLGIGLAIAAALVIWLTIWRLRHPPRKTYAWAVARNRPGDPSELDTPRTFDTYELALEEHHPRERSPIWDIEGDTPAGPVVIFTPGWGDSRIGVLPRLRGLAPHASRILTWDPPGHGDAPGRCALGTREPPMLATLARHAHETHNRPIVLAGSSLGGGVCIVTTATLGDALPIAGVIAEAPYRLPWTPARNVMRLAGYPYRWNIVPVFGLLAIRLGGWRTFDRARWAKQVICPLLVIHGTLDEVCPLQDGRDIASAAPAGTLIAIEGRTHNDLWADDEPRAAEATQTFLASLA